MKRRANQLLRLTRKSLQSPTNGDGIIASTPWYNKPAGATTRVAGGSTYGRLSAHTPISRLISPVRCITYPNTPPHFDRKTPPTPNTPFFVYCVNTHSTLLHHRQPGDYHEYSLLNFRRFRPSRKRTFDVPKRMRVERQADHLPQSSPFAGAKGDDRERNGRRGDKTGTATVLNCANS